MKSSKNPILKLLENNLEQAYNAPLTYVPKPNLKPSSVGTPCIRKLYYGYLKVESDSGWEADKIKNFEKGDAYHNLIKKWLRSSGLIIDYKDKKGKIPTHWKTGEPDPEFPVNDPDLGIKNAKIDGVALLKGVLGVEDGLWVFEIKSINQKGFSQYIQKDAKPEHKEQAMVYAFLLEQGLKNGEYSHIEELDGITEVKGVIFIYLNRESDTDDWKEFAVPKNEEVFLNVVEKIMSLKEHIEGNTLPPKTEDFCNWCPYKNKCKAEFKVET